MITFRLRLPRFPLISAVALQNPLLILLFLFFALSSCDLLHTHLFLFKVKLTNLIAVLFSLLYLLLHRSIWLDLKLFSLTSSLLGLMVFSAFNSTNLVCCLGFIFFFIFNYLFYFLISYNLFRVFHPSLILKIYSYSFYLIGSYALCQTIFSIGGITLPGAGNYIYNVVRAQGFSFEPSYYALYMTPFTIYSSMKYLLTPPLHRKISEIFWPNVFLLISTSTGCFFSYLFFLFFILLFQSLNILNSLNISLKKVFSKFLITFSVLFSLIWILNKKLITRGLLKFFYSGGLSHFSVWDRWRGLMEYWNIFLEHPLIGIGLGSGPFYLAKKKLGSQVDLLDPAILGCYSPMNVTTEILASLGLAGGILFLGFIYLLIQIFRSALKITSLEESERVILISLAISVCVMLGTLQFNQSIMRSYMWIHVGIFCGYAKYLKEKHKALNFC